MVQIIAWRRPGDKLLFEPVMVSLPTHRPQWIYNAYLQTVAYWNVCYVYVSNIVFSKWRLVHLISPSSLRCLSAPSHQPGHSVKKNNRVKIVDFLEKHNTFFNTVSRSWNRFSNIVNGTIIGMARPKNLPLDKLVGEIRVIANIDINSIGPNEYIYVGKLTISDSGNGCRLDGAKPLS